MKNPRCWARKLDDCVREMDGDHLVSVALFPGADRKERERVPLVHMRGVMRPDGTIDTSVEKGFERSFTVKNLTANVLCHEHNTTSKLTEVDAESRVLADAIDGFWDTWMNKRSIPGLLYTRKVFDVDGSRIERWFMKSLFTQLASFGLPIGGPNAETNTPTDELVDIVYGRARPRGRMLYAAGEVAEPKDKRPWFGFVPWEWIHSSEPTRRYIAGCIADIRGMRFVLNLEPQRPVPIEGLRRLMRGPFDRNLQVAPLGLIEATSENVAIRFNWSH